MFFRIIVSLLLVAATTLFAEKRPEILDRIRDYDMRHSDLLVKIVRDAVTLGFAKVRALEKMSVIYRQSKVEEGETVASRYLEGIKSGLANKSPDVREAACNAGIVFKASHIAPQLAAALSAALKEENQSLVIYACAHSLAVYSKEVEIMTPALLAKIDRYLQDFQDSSDDEKALREVCHTIGLMRIRKAFIPLLKVLQSRYSEDVKSVAQEAIHSLRAK